MKFRICHKIAVISFKAIHNRRPRYLSNLINIKRCFRYNLRSNVGVILHDPTANFKCTLGDRSFTAAAPKIWNGLADYIKKGNDFNKFKRLIKTYYFKDAYSDLSWVIVGFSFQLLSSVFTSYLLSVILNFLLGRKCNNKLWYREYVT